MTGGENYRMLYNRPECDSMIIRRCQNIALNKEKIKLLSSIIDTSTSALKLKIEIN